MRGRWLAAAAVALTTPGAACRAPRADTEAAREAREAMLYTVAAQFREPSPSLGVLEFAPVTFEDACLGIRRSGPCAAEPTPGYRLRIRRRGEVYEYRAPAANPTDVTLASAPNPRIDAPALAWRWPTGPGGCQTLLVSKDARAAVGACDGPTLELPWLGFSAAEWRYLYGRFEPFSAHRDDREIAFVGDGGDAASPAWQDAVARWAELRWSELRAGRSGAAHGRALAYRRPVRDRAGYCDVLEVTEYGVAWLGRSLCEGGGGEPGHAVWLSDELWERMDGWLGAWGPYTGASSGVEFFGDGAHAPDEAEARELVRWTDQAMAHVASTAREAWPNP